MMLISSKEHELVKLAVALQQKKTRDEKRLCLLEGLRLVEDAFLAGWSVRQLFVGQALAAETRVAELLAAAEKRRIPAFFVTEAVLKKMATTSSPQGVMAVVAQPSTALPIEAKGELWLLADELQDPGNFGAILRSADAAGCSGVIMAGYGVDPFGPKAVRATMGSLFHLPIAVAHDQAHALAWIRRQGLRVLVADASGTLPYDKADYTDGCVLVIGNEARGVSPFWLAAADAVVGIPIYGKAESLNAAVAASLLVYEAARQRFGHKA